ncbi:chromate resistance protein ChrB domain-containing protein [Roseobacter ponti]|uniref:Sulfurtransferase n=1 Tax=Roseobacter ponti TaxID=1891787 RepID=A0A858SQF1_9RHOB|nr:chromate resistance protein ChrB domain-containing protein [Roseobacter ponti]QJF51069.1 sulfurtransferase [Roseobacter ponti]
MARFTTISPSNLMRLIGTPAAPRLLDLSLDEDFAADPFQIPGARRISHTRVADVPPDPAGRLTVLICQKGRKLSYGTAAVLRARGIAAEVLEGGNLGWAAKELPRIPARVLPPQGPGARWVTRHRPKIDRIACAWLIRRFVDPDAVFLFVPAAEVADVAEKFDATPFDVPGVRWSHRDDHCTFDTMVQEFGLSTEPLLAMARIIRGADTDRHDLAPECAGLLALSVGLSRARTDDLEQLSDGMILYDAFYRWARDGQGETHDWQETE